MTQPVLLPEGTYTEAESNFIENSPPGLWPDNQDSNFGQFRKVVTDIIQDCIDEINHLSAEAFVPTASTYLSLWEEAANVPIAPAGKTDAQRRAVIMPRLQYGMFTRQRVRDIIEGFIIPTFGSSASFGVGGIAFDSGGIPLLSGTFSLVGIYRVYYDPRAFAFAVWIKNTVTPDIASLTKELARIAPSGGDTITIDNTKANVLSYFRTVRNKQPVWYGRFDGNANDASGYVDNGALNGGPAAVASPGLLTATTNDDTAAYDFDGVDDFVSVPHAAQLNVADNVTLEAWVRLDTLPGAAAFRTIFHKAGSYFLGVANNGSLLLTNDTVSIAQTAAAAIAVATTYHVVVVKNGTTVKFYLNGVEVPVTILSTTALPDSANPLRIGSSGGTTHFMDGRIDEPAVYNKSLSAAYVLDNYNAGMNIQT